MVSSNPAKATGLHDRGRIEPGLRADLVRVHLTKQPDGTQHGMVRAVWREGQRVL
jgi:alpha-D-ribose 1-methylphosphonate 5-triphosphate diphosphatase